jgi:hypothetical protein
MYLLPLMSLTGLKGLLVGAFDLGHVIDGFTVGLLLFFASWAVTATSDLILDAAPTRLDETLPSFGNYLHFVRSLFVAGAVLLNAYAIYVAREGLRFTTHFNHTLMPLKPPIAISARRSAPSAISLRPM